MEGVSVSTQKPTWFLCCSTSSGPPSCSCWLQWGGDSSGCWVCRAGAGVMAWPYTRSLWGLWTLVQTYMHVSNIAHWFSRLLGLCYCLWTNWGFLAHEFSSRHHHSLLIWRDDLTAQVNHKFFSVENRTKYIKNTLGRFLVIVILLHSCHKKRDSTTQHNLARNYKKAQCKLKHASLNVWPSLKALCSVNEETRTNTSETRHENTVAYCARPSASEMILDVCGNSYKLRQEVHVGVVSLKITQYRTFYIFFLSLTKYS